MNGSNDVRAAKKFAAAVIVILEVVIDTERLSGLDGDNAVDTPTIGRRSSGTKCS